MDAHSRVRYMLHKCNRARREHVASNMLFYKLVKDIPMRKDKWEVVRTDEKEHQCF